jgi:pimeloyl-ACP methyl ester carboxylesterase
MLHPYPFDHEVYLPQLDAANSGELRCEIIAPRFPGFGGSAWPEDHPPVLRVEDLAHEVDELIEHLGLDRPVLVGAGFGGYVALHLLASDPPRFPGGLVMACKPKPDAVDNRPGRAKVATAALTEGSGAVADLLAVSSLSPVQRDARASQARDMILRADPRALAAGMWGIHLRPGASPTLPRLTMPMIAAVGADDPVCSVADATQLVERLPKGLLRVIPNCGHAPPLERPDAVTALVEELLNTI